MEEKFEQLRARLAEVNDLESAGALLGWDQATYMPAGGAAARARQMATLGRLAHEKFTDEAVGHLLDDLKPYGESLPYDSFEASLLRVTRADYQKAVRVPASLMAQIYAHSAEGFGLWAQARPANDFAAVSDTLSRTVELSHALSSHFSEAEHVADPLIDFADYGMTVASVRPLFEQLREALVPLVQAIAEQPAPDSAMLHRAYPESAQLAFGEEVIRRFGYDFERGRQDKTHHPFMTKFSLGDVRITTRVKENDLGEALFSTMHEAGHAMYEQGVNRAFEGTPLAGGTSAGVHESQSRLWENMVGRSRGFWRYHFPLLQQRFPAQLGDSSEESFYRAINRVEPSLIRTDADEVTYNLHVIIRFGLELALLEGSLLVRDLPDAWREGYRSSLGLLPPDDKDGVLQDVHWYGGLVGGAFQGYTLGNVLAALFFDSAVAAQPAIPSDIEQGQFERLHGWLRDNVYQPGRTFNAPELVERVTGGPLRIDPYVAYLTEKYGALYEL